MKDGSTICFIEGIIVSISIIIIFIIIGLNIVSFGGFITFIPALLILVGGIIGYRESLIGMRRREIQKKIVG